MVGIEAGGPIPDSYSMLCWGAVIGEPEWNRTFCGQLSSISPIKWARLISSALFEATGASLARLIGLPVFECVYVQAS